MNINSKKICLSFLVYIAGSFAGVESTLGLHGLMLKNRLRAKISELINNYSGPKSSYNNDELKSFLEKTTEKINKLARQTDIQTKNAKEWDKKTKDLSWDDKFLLAAKNDNYRNAVSLEKSQTTRQIDYTFDCLETLNNSYLLSASVFMDEILNCMNAAEKEAQE